MDKIMMMRIAQADPQFAQIADELEAQVARMPIAAEDLTEAIQILEFVLQNPDKYKEIVTAAIKDGDLDPQQVPPEFDAVYIISLLVALYALQDRLSQRGYARGGLTVAAKKIQAAGRGGDKILAHINPREAAVLEAMGGSGTINPHTGLREYKGGFFGKVLRVVAPIALSFIAPGIGTAIGSALGAGATFAPIVGSAALGGLTSAVTGGNPLQGALMGALGGGLGSTIGGAIAPSASAATQSALGTALTGAAGSALAGQNPLLGAAAGAVGGYAGAGGFGLPSSVNTGLQTAGNLFASGADPKTALLGGTLSGLAQGVFSAPRQGEPAPIEERSIISQSPSEAVVSGMQRGIPVPGAATSPSLTGMQSGIPVPGAATSPMLTGTTPQMSLPSGAQTGSSNLFGGVGVGDLLKAGALASAASSLFSAPPDVQAAVSSLSPEQQEYFNRPTIRWDWNRMQRDANSMNLSLDQYMARYWPQITSGVYNMTPEMTPPGAARGGALSSVARLARGSGSGRADTIDARLSDGEYVLDAETVALLGDGSTEAGAKKLDAMRQQLRKHKGKTLAKGKFSPNAKSPLAYLQGAA